MILIPVKNLSSAKQRLAAVLDQSARTELAQTMLRDVVAADTCGSPARDLSLFVAAWSNPAATAGPSVKTVERGADKENKAASMEICR